MIRKVILSIALFISTICSAQEKLVPCEANLQSDPIRTVLAARIMETLGLDRAQERGLPVARVIVQPGWDEDAESAVTVYVPEGGDPSVESVIAEKGISRANTVMIPVPNTDKPTWRFGVTPEKQKIGVKTFRNTIDRDFAMKIGKMFAHHARQARYPEPKDLRIVLHGTTYSFMSSAGGSFCAQTESPDEGELPGKLVSLANALFEYAKADHSKVVRILNDLKKKTFEVSR